MGVKGKPLFFFHDGEGGGAPPVPIVQPVIDTGEKELVDPVINLTEKTTRIEERQAQHQEEMIRQLGELESRLVTATSSQVAGIEERIAKLEEKIAVAASEEGVPNESVELTLPEVETSPEPPEKVKQGLRSRRKARRKK